VIDSIQKDYTTPYAAFAYYYFTFDQPKQDVTTMLSCLIRQLCGKRPDTPDWLKGLGSSFRDKAARPGDEELEDSLWKATAGFSAVYLVIDSLDESASSQKERAPLLNSLVRLHECCPKNVHFLVTSRREPDIAAKLTKIISAPTSNEIDLHLFREKVNEDISIYLEQRLASADFEHLSAENKSLARKMLLDKADGM
jgi:hypothetical protein